MDITSDKLVVPTESQAIMDWNEEAAFMLKRRMHALGWGYAESAQALMPLGLKRSATVLNRRINRENFTAGFFVACLAAMNVEISLVPNDSHNERRT